MLSAEVVGSDDEVLIADVLSEATRTHGETHAAVIRRTEGIIDSAAETTAQSAAQALQAAVSHPSVSTTAAQNREDAAFLQTSASRRVVASRPPANRAVPSVRGHRRARSRVVTPVQQRHDDVLSMQQSYIDQQASAFEQLGSDRARRSDMMLLLEQMRTQREEDRWAREMDLRRREAAERRAEREAEAVERRAEREVEAKRMEIMLMMVLGQKRPFNPEGTSTDC
jgi:hypothetical protein